MLSLSICLNAISEHGACTATFVAVAFVFIFALSSLRTLGRITWLAIVGVVSIIAAGKPILHYLLTAFTNLIS